MRLLLDTHVFLWLLTNSPRLGHAARARIVEAEEVHVSAASIWEIAIKTGLGKLHADVDEIVRSVPASGLIELPITSRHAARVSGLPPHHNDLFDRLLVAQALTEPLLLLTADPQLAPYSDLVHLI